MYQYYLLPVKLAQYSLLIYGKKSVSCQSSAWTQDFPGRGGGGWVTGGHRGKQPQNSSNSR